MRRTAVLASICMVTVACAGEPALTEPRVLAFVAQAPAPTRAAIAAAATRGAPTPGIITRGETPLTLLGPTLEVGAQAPDVELVTSKLEPLRLASLRGKLVVLSVVPSIDTRVCETQTHKVSDSLARFPAGATVITVSRDLPFAQERFAEEASTQTVMASDAKARTFGQAFGLEVAETGLLARSTWVIAADGTIRYREIVADQGSEPNYDALIEAASAAM